MITKQQIRRIKRSVAEMESPVLSMYLVTADPSNPHENRVRARATMGALQVPDEVQRKVMGALEMPQNRSPTLAIFANDERIDVINLPIELPVVDPRTGHVEARYGEPYLAPLILALDQYERYFVVLISKDRCRTFETFLGEIEELDDVLRGPTPGEWDRIQHAKQSFPAFIAARDNAGKDRIDRHTWEWVRRFYEDLAERVEDGMNARGADRLILLGPDRDVAVFESFLSRQLQERVAAKAQGLPDPGAPLSAVLARVVPIIERAEAERTRRAIDEAMNEGARGTERCLIELQNSRVHTVIAPWHLEDRVFQTSEGYVAMKEEDAKKAGDSVQEVPLKVVLPDLASAYGARLTYARGENERRLIEDLGGVSGLLRW